MHLTKSTSISHMHPYGRSSPKRPKLWTISPLSFRSYRKRAFLKLWNFLPKQWTTSSPRLLVTSIPTRIKWSKLPQTHSRVQEEIADEKLFFWSFWNNNSSNSLGKQQQKILTAQDMLEVGRGLTELRKEGVENQLWLKCRKERSNKFMLPNNILDTMGTQKMARSLSAGSTNNGN